MIRGDAGSGCPLDVRRFDRLVYLSSGHFRPSGAGRETQLSVREESLKFVISLER